MDRQSQRTARVYTRQEIEGLIAAGRSVLIVDNKVLKVDAWLPYHPGGSKAISHMIGRDATDEVHRFHSAQTLELTDRYQIGRIEGRWTNFLPPIQGGKFRTPEQLQSTEDVDYNGSLGEDDSTDTSASSADASPIFEAAEPLASHIRRRKAAGIPRSTSSSSMSSLEMDEKTAVPKMSVMDARTQREIALDKEKYPSLDPQTQDNIVKKYRALHERIQSEGLYDCRYSSYGIECLRYAFFFGTFLFLLRSGWYLTSALFLGAVWHQLAFTVHDASHMGITHGYQTDSIIAMFVASWMGGLSACWWKANHNVHHIVTNSPEHDPDIEYVPFIAVTHRFFESLFSTYYGQMMEYDAVAKVMIRYQHRLYYLYMCIGRFNLYVLVWAHLLGGSSPKKGPGWWHRYFELAGQVFFWTWYGYGVVYRSIPGGWNRLLFILISHVITSPLHVQITLSHFAMSTADLGTAESFPQKMLRTTMDVDCPQWLDFFHGGLQFQAIHHLYPRIPRHNLRQTQKLVQGFCNEVDIPYALYGFVKGNQEVIGRLGDVARQAAIFAECQRTMAEGQAHRRA
ncbi:fatty acid desaturas-like protein [Lophiostoma macrostomum CBS 122681]|uniref:Delta 8-(E)-sphingolipid desaturase n=1 Tax=Lophiostoma macrostomum CBS 122681 TaxID=1314788 RepID=A0A6A6TAV1_9PLEO|nr:fatty acid desaturas-like protein [Lophiostoma macrostomum CBS 122681]